ncbi:MAG TPA: sialate O-acetylesterase [Lentisphaeria bacterium]|nr:MAG: hypothetical protein A2X45_14470 [Lentisphaerae bacterium GWF2_50_93]HCE45501.1 sialate O-acetylesterase [Lentisphaeria bacterium]
MKSRALAALFLSAFIAAGTLSAADTPENKGMKLNPLFSDNMVLQRDMPAPVWGTSEAGDKVTVTFSGQTKEAVAGKDGKWIIKLDPLKASAEAQIMTVSSSKTAKSPNLQIKNILVGDVWICSGQSNMAFTVSGSKDSQKEISGADYPNIRSFKVTGKTSQEPTGELTGKWDLCSPKTVSGFSAVGYFFGRELYRKLNIPIGLINSSWGGTVAEAWTTWKTLESTPELSTITEKFNEQMKVFPETKKKYEESLANWTKLYAGKKDGDELADGKKVPRKPAPPLGPDGQNAPARLYNGMINPLIPFAIKGAIWYQGESNATRAPQYRTLLPSMIKDWRTNWGQGDFPFLIVQLANFKQVSQAPLESQWAELREAQYLTSKNIPASGMAVIIDIGDAKDIHPKNKQDVGLRLSLIARQSVYGEKDLVASGPVYDSMKVEDGKIRVKFNSVGGGLEAKGGELKTFAIAGEDKKFAWAKAEISGDSVLVWSDEVKNPSIVRYAWADNPEGCNLYNKEGLPAVPFRSDAPAQKK